MLIVAVRFFFRHSVPVYQAAAKRQWSP